MIEETPSPEDAAMTTPAAPSPTPAVAEAPPWRKKSGPAKGWKNALPAAVRAEDEADARVAAKMISVRLTIHQLAAIEVWRSRLDGLDFAAAIRVLVELGLAARPREVVDPLGLLKSTFRRVRQPRKGST
jgi:hypothetical protein